MAGCLEFGEKESLDGVYVKYEDHKKEIDQLKSDLLEMSEALVLQAGQANYCVECDQWGNPGIEHKKDCTVLKAQQIIKEQ